MARKSEQAITVYSMERTFSGRRSMRRFVYESPFGDCGQDAKQKAEGIAVDIAARLLVGKHEFWITDTAQIDDDGRRFDLEEKARQAHERTGR